MKITHLFIFGTIMLSSAAFARSSGFNMGVSKMHLAFDNSFSSQCNQLDNAKEQALFGCSRYPSSAFKEDCQQGVDQAYFDIQFTTCKPSGDDCEQFGKDAAFSIAAEECNVHLSRAGVSEGTHRRAIRNRRNCYRASEIQCESDLRTKLNEWVKDDRCIVNGRRRTSEFNIYDDAYQNALDKCDKVVRSMLGMD